MMLENFLYKWACFLQQLQIPLKFKSGIKLNIMFTLEKRVVISLLVNQIASYHLLSRGGTITLRRE